MENIIYKTAQDCVSLEVSNSVYVSHGEHYSIENFSSSFYYRIRRFNSGELVSYYKDNDFGELFDVSVMFEHFIKAVSRRGLTAVIGDSFESDSWGDGQPNHWGHYIYQPTFKVDGVVCVCTGEDDNVYSFLPLSEFIKQLKAQKDSKDEYDRQRYLDGDY